MKYTGTGPGDVNDPRMEQALSAASYNNTTFVACRLAGVIVAFLIIILIIGASDNPVPTSVTAGAATTATLIVTATTLLATWRYKQRPPMPDFKIDAAEWNAAQAAELRFKTGA